MRPESIERHVDSGAKPRDTSRDLLVAACACALLSLLIGFVVGAGFGSAFDQGLLLQIALRTGRDADWLITVFRAISWLSDSGQRTFMVLLVAAWLIWKQRRRAALVVMIVPILAGVTNSILKEAFGRTRPEIVPHLDQIGNLAYPSGHASNAMAFFLLAAFLLGTRNATRWRMLAISVAVTVGMSRLALGVHWPSDVIGGWLWGASFALAGYHIAMCKCARFRG